MPPGTGTGASAAGPALGDAASLRHVLGRVQARRSLTSLPPERFAAARAVAEHHAGQRRCRPTGDDVRAELTWALDLDESQLHRLAEAERELSARLGLAARSPVPLNRYERRLEADSARTGGLTSLLAGASRLARVAAPAGVDRALVGVLAGVAVPALVGYARWVLDEADRAGLGVLYAGPGAAAVVEVVERLRQLPCPVPQMLRLPWDRVPEGLAAGEAGRLGLLDTPVAGVLEVGWTGALAADLVAAARRLGAQPPAASLSFGLDAGAEVGTAVRRAYLFDRCEGFGPALDDGAAERLMEGFCTDGVRVVLLGVLDHLAIDDDLADLSAELRPVVVALLSTVAGAPSASEARAWAALTAGASPTGLPQSWPAAARRLRPLPVRWATGRPVALGRRVRRKLIKTVREGYADRFGPHRW